MVRPKPLSSAYNILPKVKLAIGCETGHELSLSKSRYTLYQFTTCDKPSRTDWQLEQSLEIRQPPKRYRE